MIKYMCLKDGCSFMTESKYEAEEHQKGGNDHNLFMVDVDYAGHIKNTQLLVDTLNEPESGTPGY